VDGDVVDTGKFVGRKSVASRIRGATGCQGGGATRDSEPCQAPGAPRAYGWCILNLHWYSIEC
jgi:hypothetical protein